MSDRGDKLLKLGGALSGVAIHWLLLGRYEPYLTPSDLLIAFLFAVWGAAIVTLCQVFARQSLEVGPPQLVFDIPFVGVEDGDEKEE